MVHGACQVDGRWPLVLSQAMGWSPVRFDEGRHRHGSYLSQNAVDIRAWGVDNRVISGRLFEVYARQVLISASVTCILQIAAMVGDSKSALTAQVRSLCNVLKRMRVSWRCAWKMP